MNVLRSIGAVIAGYLVFAVPGGLLFGLSGRDPHAPADMTFMAISTAGGMLFAGLGGYVAARISPRHPVRHVAVVAGLIAFGALVSLLYSPAGTARWTQISALVFMIPAALAGGCLPGRAAPSTWIAQ